MLLTIIRQSLNKISQHRSIETVVCSKFCSAGHRYLISKHRLDNVARLDKSTVRCGAISASGVISDILTSKDNHMRQDSSQV